MKKITLMGLLISQFIFGAAFAAPSTQEKKGRLDEIMTRHEEKGRTMRYVGAGVTTAFGIGAIAYGSGSSVDASDRKGWQIAGALLTVGGIAGFFIPSEQERFVEVYRSHSEEGDLARKLAAGETLFRYKAEEMERMRKGMGVFTAALGTGLIIYGAAEDGLASKTQTTYTILGAGLIIGGIVGILVKSELEKDYSDYRAWSRGESTKKAALSEPRFALAPVLDSRGGAGAWGGVSLDF